MPFRVFRRRSLMTPSRRFAALVVALSIQCISCMAQDSGRLSAVTFRGNQTFSDASLLDQLSLSVPGWFARVILGKEVSTVNLTRLEQYSTILTGFYQREGFLYASIRPPAATRDEDTKGVRLTFDIEERQPVLIEAVSFQVVGQTNGDQVTIQNVLGRVTPFLESVRVFPGTGRTGEKQAAAS